MTWIDNHITIKDWKRIWSNPLKDWIYKFKAENRSLEQNRLYHKYLADIKAEFDEQGIYISTDDLHEWLKQKLLSTKYKKNPLTWKRLIVQKSTAKLNTKEFSEYIKDIEKYLMQQFNISVMLATDGWYDKRNWLLV